MKGWKMTDEWEYAYLNFIKLHPNKMTHGDTKNTHSDIEHINPGISDWYLHTRAGNIQKSSNELVNKKAQNEFPIVCNRNKKLSSNVLLPNGDVALCCMDYGLQHIIGNLETNTHNEILKSDQLAEILLLNNQEGFSNNTLCRTCNDTTCITPYNTDEYYEIYPSNKKYF